MLYALLYVKHYTGVFVQHEFVKQVIKMNLNNNKTITINDIMLKYYQ